eukprot:1347027-Amorphochlora_amoeboformis.AAC.2
MQPTAEVTDSMGKSPQTKEMFDSSIDISTAAETEGFMMEEFMMGKRGIVCQILKKLESEASNRKEPILKDLTRFLA